MDFIERFFGFSPDGGSGATEAMYFIAAAAVLAMIMYGRRYAVQRRNRRR